MKRYIFALLIILSVFIFLIPYNSIAQGTPIIPYFDSFTSNIDLSSPLSSFPSSTSYFSTTIPWTGISTAYTNFNQIPSWTTTPYFTPPFDSPNFTNTFNSPFSSGYSPLTDFLSQYSSFSPFSFSRQSSTFFTPPWHQPVLPEIFPWTGPFILPFPSPSPIFVLPYQKPSYLDCKVETDKSEYTLGEPIHITFTLKNNRSRSITLKFSSSKQFDVIVKNSMGVNVWQLSNGRAYTQSFTEITLDAGEEKSFQELWDQRDDSGMLVSSGSYTIEAFLTAINYKYYKDSLEVTIIGTQIKGYSNSGCKGEGGAPGYYFSEEDPEFYYEYQENILYLYHNDATYNCCIQEIAMTMSIENSVINIYEDEILLGGGCFCLCDYDLTVRISDLPPGTYVVQFFNRKTGELLGVIPEAIVDPLLPVPSEDD